MPSSNPTSFLFSVAFQDGFADDTVVARLGDRVVFRQEGVTTDPRIGLATSFEVDVQAVPATLTVEVPTRDLSEAIPIGEDDPRHLGVSVEGGGGVRLRWSEQPFGYL